MKKYLGCILAVVPSLLLANVVQAEDWQQEISELREDIQVLQRQMYRNGDTVSSSKSSESVATPSSATSSAVNADVQVKMGEYDETMRKLNGRVDDIEYKIKQVDSKLDKINRDMEIRFKILEGKQIPDSLSAPAPTIPTTYAAPVADGPAKSVMGDSIQGEDLTPIAGSKQSDAKTEETPKTETKKEGSPQKLILDEESNAITPSTTTENKAMSANDMYNSGMSAYNNGLYDEAEMAFDHVLKQYPKDNLAGNAQYWLGEVYVKQGNLDKAKVAFKKGYENYQNGNKSADSLFRLGATFESLKDKKSACIVYNSFSGAFPKANADLSGKVKAKIKSLGC